MKKELYSTAEQKAKAILIAVTPQGQTEYKTEEYLGELAFLAQTLGLETVKTFTQKLERSDPKTYVGKGKLEDINAYVIEHDIDVIIFDDDLTTAQSRNLDRAITERVIIDRSLLILQIFMKRAQTAQARTQVELAQYEYMLPRLINLWSHHSRQRGGIGMRGPGETELETDKRIIRDKIAFLKKKLAKIETQSALKRKSRDRMVRMALVGYTNVGKSTLMRVLTKSDVFAENKLFATVDSTVRKMVLNNIPLLLTDTVGFIRKLPTTLIESFKSTLNEIVEADILLHVVDISHDGFEEHIEVVNKTLGEIGAADKPTILVFNKVDAFLDKEYPPFDDNPPATVAEWQASELAQDNNSIFISAIKKDNIDTLKERIFELVEKRYYEIFPNHRKFDYNQYWKQEE